MASAQSKARLDPAIFNILEDRCIDCHDPDVKKGDLDLTRIIEKYDPVADHDTWVEIERAIAKGKMPPPKKKPLADARRQAFAKWFEKQFVMPGGVQHAGPNPPRRLTREELQNTLEDILKIDLRVQVTNSRLHVIPETVIEKFFGEGVLGKSGFSNDAATLNAETIDFQTFARCFAMVLSHVDSSETSRKHLFGSAALPKTIPVNQARQIIGRFGEAAFRRPLTSQELAAFVGVYQKMAPGKPATDAIKSSFLAILLSPPFLFRFEEPKPGQTPVTGMELATRLSYFLWSSPPDAELKKLAAAGKLRQPMVLKAQVRRMLADPKRVALAENMGGEWFDYKKLRRQSAVNKRSDKMAGFYRTQYEEALLFFDSLIRYDQPIFAIVDADWAFLNRHQTGIYKMRTAKKAFDGVTPLPAISIHYRRTSRQVKPGNYEYKHQPLELVQLTDPNRGGFITTGPTLSVTSTENRTSPIRRGAWVMERILGEHFKVPKDVPALEESQKKAKTQKLNLTDNEILELHSSQKGCVACHKYIDPVGFGLDGFDQLGIGRAVPTPKAKIVGGEMFKWTPATTPKAFAKKTWVLKKAPKAGADCRVVFQWTHGSKGLDVKNVRLESGRVKLLDAHAGFTGGKNRKNIWTFKIPAGAPTTGWRLTAEIKGSHGTQSNGVITIGDAKIEGVVRKLPNGATFSSPEGLKRQLLAGYRDQVIDNVVRRVLAYALGRNVTPVDRPAIGKIEEQIKQNDYRMTAVIEAVVLSYPFRHKESQR